MEKKISIIIPVYNEASNIQPMLDALERFVPVNYRVELIYVDDGSTDNTLEMVRHIFFRNQQVHYISFSRNFGHQNALKAGMDKATGDCVITLDGDLQHPPELIPVMLSKWEEGYDVVYTRRREDKRLPFSKRYTSKRFYGIMQYMSGLNIEPGIADYRLIDRQVVDILVQFREPDPFLRGIIKWMGFKQYAIDYNAHERLSGVTKYSTKKMLKFALQGITSFSVRPLYLSIILGSISTILSLIYIPYVIWHACMGYAVPGWASTIITIMFFGGLQMLLLGIIGIYIGKIFIQTKRRPEYIIRTTNMEK
ncbi:glycosyltransferase family 2 protein [Parabacteroides pacaensis]|uniref:glycosyltransferase family 2 protein n=1 Tax=Parabacteroides pacaensis TaxID=2086575 RepID=UPI000D0E7B55|nr:glycosyltransferase family 2 protein [Parabacteroides pacaensis]